MKAQQDTIELAEKVKQHIEKLATTTDEIYKEKVSELSFDVGRKLFLEVEVTDKEMTRFLYDWLYSVNEEKENMEYFGCKLQSIHFGNPKDDFKNKLLAFIESTANGS